jgi:DNA-binding NarL/FixJ family response regulator
LIHEVMRRVIARAIHPQEIIVASDSAAAVRHLRDLADSDLVIMELGLRGYRGISALVELRRRFPRPRYIVLSALDDRQTVMAALEAGACAYLTKATPIRVIEAALTLVAAGGTYAPAEILREAGGEPAPAAKLAITERQLEVLRLLLQGLPNRGIARTLRIAESTVKQHLRAVFHALKVSTRTEALVAITRLGIKLD